MRILGVDPGSRKTGFGCIEKSGKRLRALDHGTINLDSKLGIAKRLAQLSEALGEIIQEHRPDVLVVEKAFVKNNIQSALRLGETRGAILLCGASRGIEVVEYTPAEIKRTVAGSGRADKEQMAKMVRLLCSGELGDFESFDASDAMSIAICHALFGGRSPVSAPRRRVKLSRALGLS